MDNEAPFLDAIKANPDDAVARLVYADWLEERGDARGEFLRLQVESQRMRDRLYELRRQLDPR